VIRENRRAGCLGILAVDVRQPVQPPRDHAHQREVGFQPRGVFQPAVFNGTAICSRAPAFTTFLPIYLRQLAIQQSDLHEALRCDNPPAEILALIDTLSALLRPALREQIKSSRDVVALLMVTMGHLDQEELRTVLLDTKNRIQDIVTIYRGSLYVSMVRVGEVYKAAIKRNSAAIIAAHNHPSSDSTPSPEDVLVTQEIVKAGILLDTECLDHIMIGLGKWVSMRERGLGFHT
jgi:hypothetical protein